jgi:integrase/recombinase XerC
MKPRYAYAPGDWGTYAKEWRRALEADNKSPNTVRIYLHSVRMLGEWAMAQSPPLEPSDVDAVAIRDFVKHRLDTTSAGNAHNNYRAIRTFFVWLVDEGELDDTPMRRTSPPILPETIVPIEQVTAMIATCRTRDFRDLRDEAIIRTLWASGSRRDEITKLNVDDVDLETDAIRVTGKGRRDRVIPLARRPARR